ACLGYRVEVEIAYTARVHHQHKLGSCRSCLEGLAESERHVRADANIRYAVQFRDAAVIADFDKGNSCRCDRIDDGVNCLHAPVEVDDEAAVAQRYIE